MLESLLASVSEEGQGRYEALAALLLQVGHFGLLGVCVQYLLSSGSDGGDCLLVHLLGATCFCVGALWVHCGRTLRLA